jgi:hypothetical protein
VKTTTRKTAFEKRCEAAAEKTGVDVYFCYDPPGNANVFEDDGALHIRQKSGQRACFDVGCANDSVEQQNARTRAVLSELKLEKHIGPSTLVDETDEDEGDECPCCGREY